MALARTVVLLTIELEARPTASRPEWQVRSLLLPSESVPSDDEIRFYYHYLLGLEEYQVRTHRRVVPETFHVGLIGSLVNEAPTACPHMDKVFDTVTDLERYYALLDRLAEIEFLRLNCGVVKETESNISLADRILVEAKLAKTTTAKPRREEWIKAVLESLNDDWDIEHDNAADIQEADTLAWIFAPMFKDTRNEKGFRILLNLTVGAEWASKVATGLYPDLTVCRRISIVNWSMSTHASRDLVHQIIRWYIRSQVLEGWDESISPWITNAVFDVDRLLQPFRRIEYAKYSMKAAAGTAEQQSIPQLLQRVEDTHLHAATSAEIAVYEPVEEEWMSYMYHIVRRASHGLFAFEKCEVFIRARVQEWMRTRRGLNLHGSAFFGKWEPLWEVTLLNRPEARQGARFSLFLKALDVHEPARRCLMKELECKAFMKSWMELFVEKEVVTNPDMRIVATPFFDVMRQWVYQYLPDTFAKLYLRTPSMTKCMAEGGFKQEKKPDLVVFKECTYRQLTVAQGFVKQHTDLVRHKHEKIIGWAPKKRKEDEALVLAVMGPVAPAARVHPTIPTSTSGPTLRVDEIHLGTF